MQTQMPVSPWEIPPQFLRKDGSMICRLWLPDKKGYGVDVQWGPYGFQRTLVEHQDPYSGRDCRACRYIVMRANQARLTRRKMELDFMGIFRVRLTEDGTLQMTASRR